MKTMRAFLVLAVLLSVIFASGQNTHPTSGEDYKTIVETDYTGENYIVYSYYVESQSSRTIVLFNYRIKEEYKNFESYQDIPEDVIVLAPWQKIKYFKVKAYGSDNAPTINWNAKYMDAPDEYKEYPQKNKDYVYHWKSKEPSDGYKTYSYHLHNLSDKDIKFHTFTLTNEGGTYYLIDNLLQQAVIAGPGESIQIVKFNLKEGTESPSVNWYADWPAFEGATDDFCSAIITVLEASREEGFTSIKGPLKESAEESLLGTDIYYSTVHIPGAENEVIEYLWFFWEYHCYIGSSGSETEMRDRIEDFRYKLKACLPSEMVEKEIVDDDLISAIKGYSYEGEVNYNMHYISIKLMPDYDIDGYYYLEMGIEEVY